MNIEKSWIKNFKYQDKKLTSSLFDIKLIFLYINKSNELEYIKEGSTYILQSPFFDKKDIIKNIKENSIIHKKNYKLLSLLKFNIDIDTENLEDFLSENHNNNYMSNLTNLDNIEFNNSSKMFNDLNNLFFIFYEQPNIRTNNTTKKIKFNSKSKRNTKTKRFKD
tara:strand:- start:4694 stop:5188 length:495 start_codon:yes stop_codon:yes gene_type:complete